MACYHPITGFRCPDGKVRFKGAGVTVFHDQPVKISCGQCSGCRLERSRNWAVRCVHESQMHEENSFVTLTYSDDNLPADRGLDIRHVQQFLKRLRNEMVRCNKLNPKHPKSFRYFHCGEYGNAPKPGAKDQKGYRPHYHILFFGVDFSSDRKYKYKTKHGDLVYTSELLDHLWEKGNCEIGSLTVESAAYTARYIMKKHTGKKAWLTYGEHVDTDTGEIDFYRQPPYTSMSRRPGLGASWLLKFHSDVYPNDAVILKGGKKVRPPAYYDRLLHDSDPDLHETLKKQRATNARPHRHNNTPERLTVREKVADLQYKRYKRNL